MVAMPLVDRITVPIDEFCKLTDICRSVVYAYLQSNELRSVKIGRRRMIVVASYKEMVERAMREQPEYTPGRRPGRPRKIAHLAASEHAASVPMAASAGE